MPDLITSFIVTPIAPAPPAQGFAYFDPVLNQIFIFVSDRGWVPMASTAPIGNTSPTLNALTVTNGVTFTNGPITLPGHSIADGALSTNVDLLNGNQTITGIKTFSANPVFNNSAIADAALSSNVALKNINNAFSALETFNGGATFATGSITFSVNPSFNAGATFTAGSITTGNNVIFQAQDSGGTAQPIMVAGADNTFRVGWQGVPASNGHLIFYANGLERARITPGGPFSTGTGDAISYAAASSAQLFRVAAGTAGSPDLIANPLVKFERTVSLTAGQVTGDGVDVASTLQGSSSVPVGGAVQGVGVFGYAKTASTTSPADACGGYFLGRSLSGSSRTGLGIFAMGRVDAGSTGLPSNEIAAYNDGPAGSVVPNGFSGNAIWLHPAGSAKIGAGLEISNPFNTNQFDVAIHITGQNGSPAATAVYQDDSTTPTGILIKGTHSTASIAVGSGSGPVLVGGQSALGGASTRLEVQGPSAASAIPLAWIGQTAGSFSYSLDIRNSVGVARIGISGSTNGFITGSVGGDLVIFNSTGTKSIHIGGGASVIQVTNASALGFFQTTPVAQQSAVGTATGYAAGATAVTFHSDDTYTGNTGATAYTINGIVHALKVYGLLAA